MRSANKLDPNNWVVRADKFYLVSLVYDDVRDLAFLTVGELVPDDRHSDFLSIAEEVWSGQVMTTTPRRLLLQLTEDFAHANSLDVPVDLVYEWGGLLRGRSIAITNIHRGLLQ